CELPIGLTRKASICALLTDSTLEANGGGGRALGADDQGWLFFKGGQKSMPRPDSRSVASQSRTASGGRRRLNPGADHVLTTPTVYLSLGKDSSNAGGVWSLTLTYGC